MTAFGSPPHHDRVLAVVLVVANPYRKGDVPYHVLGPNSPEWEAFWQDIGRPDEGLNGTSEAPTTDECVQRACPTGGFVDCGRLLVGQGSDTSDPTCVRPRGHSGPCAPMSFYGLRFTPEEEHRHRAYEREQLARQLVPEPASEKIPPGPGCIDGPGCGEDGGCGNCGSWPARVNAYFGKPEPACPCGEPAPPGAKPCTFADPCLYARGKYWPGTTDRVPEETPAQAHNRIVAVRRARLRDAGRRLADRADLLERLSPLDHPYPEEGTL